ncbi:uncharacterized protein G2W53_026377 [Senna tora]|uniref:Uncharacterized protein n=1 Tax=Senna tora TaxID=362788 RepID=A0A834TGT7_9FABA|nr:uncharacterized protein G2W53_026377 [Senna tora]
MSYMSQGTPSERVGGVGADWVYSVIGRRTMSHGYCDGTMTGLMVLRRDSRSGQSVL